MLADTVGSVGVIVGAVVIAVTGWDWVDPLVGVAIGAVDPPPDLAARPARRCASSCRRRRRASTSTRSRPTSAALAGVVDVHDLHVWTLTSDMEVATAHLMVRRPAPTATRCSTRPGSLLLDRYGIDHATLQVEPDDHEGCDELTW